jgi:hypothetical protein
MTFPAKFDNLLENSIHGNANNRNHTCLVPVTFSLRMDEYGKAWLTTAPQWNTTSTKDS